MAKTDVELWELSERMYMLLVIL